MCEANVFYNDLADILMAQLGEQAKPIVETAISKHRKIWHGEEVYITSHTSTDARVAALRADITKAMQDISRQYGITPKHAQSLYRGRPRKNAPPEEQDELFP
jgi:antitoxin (DNA-binding transcriptional repressor) of toxin-antitoxin stability system